ncbi:MAG: hypothetical protein IJK61_07190 [Bacteroidetes bacterium]|nr:hypothetical protein [Bacteroidota bacterium]MBR3090560.1 hypothetical protein [Bacteroidota bacterium]
MAIGAKFATIKLLSDNMSTKYQIIGIGDNTQTYSGGGLQYIQPGIELSALLYLDKKELHRFIGGIEYMSLTSKEKIDKSAFSSLIAKHNVKLLDIFTGWHYAFWDMDWQEAKLYIGPEIMFNFMLNNSFSGGTKYKADSEANKIIETKKDPTFRIGSRIRTGVEGKIKNNFYVNINFAIGIYNLLLRDDSTGELLNSKNVFDTKESFQPFYNFNIGLQYKF